MSKKANKSSAKNISAIYRTSPAEKAEVLKLYARLRQNEAEISDEIPFELTGSEPKEPDLGSLIEQLNLNSPEQILDALKQMERMAEHKKEEVKKVLSSIVKLLKINPDDDIKYEATKLLGKLKDDSVAGDLIDVIGGNFSERVKEGAIKALSHLKADGYAEYLTGLLNDTWNQSIRVRKAAAYALGRLVPDQSINILCDSLINDPDAAVREEAASSIAISALRIEKNQVSAIVCQIISQINFKAEADENVRIATINIITVSEEMGAVDALILTLKDDPSPRVRGQAASSLAHFFDPKIERALIESVDTEEGSIKKRMALALAQYAMRNPLGLHDEVCEALINIQKLFPKGSYIWKEAVKALPAC